MDLIKCPLVRNRSYTSPAPLRPRGVMVHSTGVNNPALRRYVQPVESQDGYGALLELLGRNLYGNHWNRPMYGKDAKSVHAFIGLLADGSVGTVQTLPWEIQAWHCGKGSRGSGNTTHIGFEICEDGMDDPAYFAETYSAAVELTAYLCELYDLDPLEDGVVIGHGEGYWLGIASQRKVDRDPWFGQFGVTMDDFRRDVAEYMEEGDNMTLDTLDEVQKKAGWAYGTVRKLTDCGVLRGTDGATDSEGRPAGLALTVSMLRILVILDRCGVFDNIGEETETNG